MHPTRSSPESILKKGLKELSLVHSKDQLRAFMTYLSELKKWNKAYNLTSLKTDEDIVIKHFLDSLLYLKAIPGGEISVMDVGSGAGFPGIPMKIMRPEIEMHLLEPSRKKAGFLRHVIRMLGLGGSEVIEKRIEDVGLLMVDVAVTRALFDIKEFAGKAFSHLNEGGRLVVSKGPRVSEELKALKKTDYELLTLALPFSTIKRFIVVINKVGRGACSAAKACSESSGGAQSGETVLCVNRECRLRKAGCRGFEGCPGFKANA
jgi:16S rRNA (guanine527-N7)-methyltransferase